MQLYIYIYVFHIYTNTTPQILYFGLSYSYCILRAWDAFTLNARSKFSKSPTDQRQELWCQRALGQTSILSLAQHTHHVLSRAFAMDVFVVVLSDVARISKRKAAPGTKKNLLSIRVVLATRRWPKSTPIEATTGSLDRCRFFKFLDSIP